MSNDSLSVSYNQKLKPLEETLLAISRPGDFFVKGSKVIPMPKLEVENVGVLSFPVPKAQAKGLIQEASRAPYGRGESTIVDTSVRKVWQLDPKKLSITGSSWEETLSSIVSVVKKGLGCADVEISADLYKMLIYDEGSFFLPHRDSEKSEGMFGTLVIVLPSFHQGGELIIRHAGHQERIDLSSQEVSQLQFAAFYADCEHEVLPIKEGYRICLVYNLIQEKRAQSTSLCAPLYDKEIKEVGDILTKALNQDDGPRKLVWLLEHQYSPSGLSFDDLKNADAARAQVLLQAANRADCAAYLGIVHLQESGYGESTCYRPSYRRSRYYHEDDENDSFDDFEIYEVEETEQFIDSWMDPQGQEVDFGSIPLEEGELLPKGALDNEPCDEQRLYEATGNEGTTFDRAYHRAALVIWKSDRYLEVLLQGGVSAAIPYFEQSMENRGLERPFVEDIGRRILDDWERSPPSFREEFRDEDKQSTYLQMLELLLQFGNRPLLTRFISEILPQGYDGSQNDTLVKAYLQFEVETVIELLCECITKFMPVFHWPCLDLVRKVLSKDRRIKGKGLEKVMAELVFGLKRIRKKDELNFTERLRMYKAKKINASFVVDLWSLLQECNLQKQQKEKLQSEFVAHMIDQPSIFDPQEILVDALIEIYKREETIVHSPSFVHLWKYTNEYFLKRNEYPPQFPSDWKQDVKTGCKCADCRELQKFVDDPIAQEHRFRMAQARRDHLEGRIYAKVDIDCKTERKGSPHTLICTKTRKTYENMCLQYLSDMNSVSTLLPLVSKEDDTLAKLLERAMAAVDRFEAFKKP